MRGRGRSRGGPSPGERRLERSSGGLPSMREDARTGGFPTRWSRDHSRPVVLRAGTLVLLLVLVFLVLVLVFVLAVSVAVARIAAVAARAVAAGAAAGLRRVARAARARGRRGRGLGGAAVGAERDARR